MAASDLTFTKNAKKVIFDDFWTPLLGSGFLVMRQKLHLCNSFLSSLYLFDSIFSGIDWIDRLHDCKGKTCFAYNGCHGNIKKEIFPGTKHKFYRYVLPLKKLSLLVTYYVRKNVATLKYTL